MLIEEYDKKKHNLRAIKDLLSMAVGRPTPERLTQLLDEFYSSDGRTIFVALHENKITGIIGVDYTNMPHGLITHIAVRPSMRMQDIGSHLITHATDTLGLTDIGAETDQDAVDFYHACGFETREIESQWPGVRRFRCFKEIIKPIC